MNKGVTVILALVVGLAAGVPLGGRLMSTPADDEGGGTASGAFAAVPGGRTDEIEITTARRTKKSGAFNTNLDAF